MPKLRGEKKAQSTAEYAILIGLVVAVAIGMQTYVKRGIQGRVKDEADGFTVAVRDASGWSDISSNANATLAYQYEPSELSGRSTQDMSRDDSASRMAATGTVVRNSTQTTAQAVGDFQNYDY